MTERLLRGCLLAVLLAMLTACDDQTSAVPTLIDNLDTAATQQVMTANAPPPGYRDALNLPTLDQGLDELAGWRYTLDITFDGVFAGTQRPATAVTSAEVWYDQRGSERRVVLQIEGEVFGEEDPLMTEAVRLGPDVFLVQDDICATVSGTEGAVLADLDIGELIGGVTQAVPNGQRARVNNTDVWRYAFLPDDLALTNVRLTDSGRVISANGELWFAPEHDAVVRFYMTMNLENAIIFDGQLPVTGLLIVRYDLYDIGTPANISVPFGC